MSEDIKIPKSWKELNVENLNYAVQVGDLEAYCDKLRAALDYASTRGIQLLKDHSAGTELLATLKRIYEIAATPADVLCDSCALFDIGQLASEAIAKAEAES